MPYISSKDLIFELESKLLKFLKNKTIQMFKFDVLAQQRLLFVCLFVCFLVKTGSSVYILLFFKTGQKAEKKDTETMKSLNPFVEVFILFAQEEAG